MRKSDLLLWSLGACVALFLLTLVDAALRGRDSAAAIERRAALVADLELTDLSLFTEARYTRHLSQADLHTAFQDHPLGLEHFPSGSLVMPPPTIIEPHEPVPAQTEVPD